jgi:oligogalacturonide lyase
MSQHNYKLEPNVRFSPDKKLVIFTSNMFGPSFILAAETEKATDIKPGELLSTPELAARFNPGRPPDTSNVPK